MANPEAVARSYLSQIRSYIQTPNNKTSVNIYAIKTFLNEYRISDKVSGDLIDELCIALANYVGIKTSTETCNIMSLQLKDELQNIQSLYGLFSRSTIDEIFSLVFDEGGNDNTQLDLTFTIPTTTFDNII